MDLSPAFLTTQHDRDRKNGRYAEKVTRGSPLFGQHTTSLKGFLRMRTPALLLALLVVGCGGNGDRDPPGEVVEDYLRARGSASCQYLTASQAALCRRPRVAEPPAHAVVIERVHLNGDRAIIRASYDWTGYRRHSTFVLVRRADDWLIAREAAA
jgi:hypothetical protein